MAGGIVASPTNGTARLDRLETRQDTLAQMLYEVRADVRVIRASNQATANEVAEINETVKEAAKEQKRIAEGKQQTSISTKIAYIGVAGVLLASVITSLTQLLGG